MKLLELIVENVCGVPNGAFSFAGQAGRPRDVAVLAGDAGSLLLETIAALLEAVRVAAPEPHLRAWWARRLGREQARLRARWGLSEGEATCAGAPTQVFTSAWTAGAGDTLPRELGPDGVGRPLSKSARADLAAYSHIDATRSAVWMGGPDADPLAEMLAGMVLHDAAGTRVRCQAGVGAVAASASGTLEALNQAIAPMFPSLRVERVACARGELPVACFRGRRRVELERLAEEERDALHIAATVITARVRNGVVLVDRPELHVPRDAHGRWLEWLAGLVPTNQLIVAMASPRASLSSMTITLTSRIQP